jgi:hypothetical protein
MARMIPPYLSDDCRSPGEKLLFARFRDDPGTKGWVVLHSLGVVKHPKRLEGEIDFVVIVPGEGVLCLEVKAGKVSREEGVWKYGNGPFATRSNIGPFRQASEAMYGIREYVKKRDSSLQNLMFFSGVFFTYIDFDSVSSEWQQWQYADRTLLNRSSVSECCRKMLQSAHEHIRNTLTASWYNPVQSRPTPAQVKRLLDLLRGNFEYFISPRVSVEQCEHEIMRFTEEQFSALDVLEENSRIVYKGPAGTGKTFLAIEAMRRSMLTGRRTLLSCYNSLLGRWLRTQVEPIIVYHPQLVSVGTFHSILLQLSGIRPPKDASSSFWSVLLPQNVLARIRAGIVKTPLYDTVIIDEAQDLISDEHLDVIDLLLKDGIAGGRWVMFGDFERQAIYAGQDLHAGIESLEILKKRAPVCFSYPLRVNCRNVEAIAIGLELACKLQPGYSRILHHGQTAEIDVDFYCTRDEQIRQLQHHLRVLHQSYHPEEIIILSVHNDLSSCAWQLSQQEAFENLRAFREVREDGSFVGFTSIHAFKGMEAPAIILTDIEEFQGPKAEALLYVGMSRARQRLVMLMHEKCRTPYLQTVCKTFSSTSKKGKT